MGSARGGIWDRLFQKMLEINMSVGKVPDKIAKNEMKWELVVRHRLIFGGNETYRFQKAF